MNGNSIVEKVFCAFKQGGFQEIIEKIKNHMCEKKDSYRDFLFIYSGELKYKQKERTLFLEHIWKLELFNYSAELVEEDDLTIDYLRYFKVFIFGKCGEKEELEVYRNRIRQLNKRIVVLTELPDFWKHENVEKHQDKSFGIMEDALRLINNYKSILPYNVGFFLPGLAISGGVRVVLKHACILQENGKDVTLFVLDSNQRWYEFDKHIFPVINLKTANIYGYLDHAIATMWTTVSVVLQCSTAIRKSYLVQNFETDFYSAEDPFYVEANRTYSPHVNIDFFTISKWCQKWLREIFGQETAYIQNGIEVERFVWRKRDFSGRIRILIEGDCEVDYKNVDEAFEVVDKLNLQKYEIWYMSYNGQPKTKYRVDKFFHKVPYKDVSGVYEKCHILLKTSLLESFSYPPLEMMATGGYVVAVPNEGNAEYLADE